MNRILIPGILLIFIAASCNNSIDKDRIIKIGKAIINIDTSKTSRPVIPDVVFIGDGLIDKISRVRAGARSYNFKVEKGDFPEPYGNNKADCILTIDTDFEDIGIRLKFNNRENKYDILGWMTL